MGATEILEALDQGDKLTTSELAEKLDVSLGAIKHTLKRLLKDTTENVEVRRMTIEETEIKFGHKVYSRVFIYWVKNK